MKRKKRTSHKKKPDPDQPKTKKRSDSNRRCVKDDLKYWKDTNWKDVDWEKYQDD